MANALEGIRTPHLPQETFEDNRTIHGWSTTDLQGLQTTGCQVEYEGKLWRGEQAQQKKTKCQNHLILQLGYL